MTLRLNLGQYLKEHGISAYRLVQETDGQLAPNTVYGLARRPAQRIDLDTVAKILHALGRVRGERVQITEMLEDLPDMTVRSVTSTLEDLLAQIPVEDPATFPKFRYSGRGRRVDVSGGPSVVDIISEGRDR